jgi:hypothetical protein
MQEPSTHMPIINQIIGNDYVVRPEISFDGRTLAITGKNFLYIIEP